MLANEFVPTPVSAFGYLRHAGLIGPHGPTAKAGMRHLADRMQRVVGPVQEVTSADARVRLDTRSPNSLGIPGARLSGRLHANDLAVQQLLGQRAAEWLPPAPPLPSPTVHDDERDPEQRPTPGRDLSHGHRSGRLGHRSERLRLGPPQSRVIDGSLHVTNGGVNPVLTIFANAFRIMHSWTRSGTGYV